VLPGVLTDDGAGGMGRPDHCCSRRATAEPVFTGPGPDGTEQFVKERSDCRLATLGDLESVGARRKPLFVAQPIELDPLAEQGDRPEDLAKPDCCEQASPSRNSDRWSRSRRASTQVSSPFVFRHALK
jgi:hypothetical protein